MSNLHIDHKLCHSIMLLLLITFQQSPLHGGLWSSLEQGHVYSSTLINPWYLDFCIPSYTWMEFTLSKAFALQQRLVDLMAMSSRLLVPTKPTCKALYTTLAGESSTKLCNNFFKMVFPDRFSSNFIHSFSKVRTIDRNNTTDDKHFHNDFITVKRYVHAKNN